MALTDIPGFIKSICGLESMAIRTGIRCTTLLKLPVALSGGISEKVAPEAGEKLSIFPVKLRLG